MAKENLTSVYVEWSNGEEETILLDDESLKNFKSCLLQEMKSTQIVIGDPAYKFLNMNHARRVEIDD